MKSNRTILKGQTMEVLGIVILGVSLIALLFFLGVFSMKGYAASAEALSDRQEDESFKAGVNSILYTTETKTGKTLMELLGMASKEGNTTLYFGPGVGAVDVKKELEWRFDAIYGKGNWYLKIPFPNVTADIQIVAVVDTSNSMCDQIKKLATDVPDVLERIRKKGRKAEMTMFLLGTPNCCVQDASGNWAPFNVADIRQTDYFHVTSMPPDYKGMPCTVSCGNGMGGDEDWGDGLACAIEMGPYKGPGDYGWRENVVKVAIPTSDELPGGIECGCPSAGAKQNFDKGLQKALEKEVYVFAFRGETCEPVRTTQLGCYNPLTVDSSYCTCARGPLRDWMADISNQTKGKMYDLSAVVESSDTIEKIIMSVQPNRVPYLEAGTIPPKGEKMAVTSLLPVTILGKYVELYVYHWN
jgi:hypothetical protein